MCYIKTKLTEADVGILLHLWLMTMFLTSKAFRRLQYIIYNLFQTDRKSPFSLSKKNTKQYLPRSVKHNVAINKNASKSEAGSEQQLTLTV